MSLIDFGEQISFARWRIGCLKQIAEDFRAIGDDQRCKEAFELVHRLERELAQLSTLANIIHAIDRQAEAWEMDNQEAIDNAGEDAEALELAHTAIAQKSADEPTIKHLRVKPIR